MTDRIITRSRAFERVELSENRYQALLGEFAMEVFPAGAWWSFKPAVWSPLGTAHPDALLASLDGSRWWVVEVEVARHSSIDHLDPQLAKLREGHYRREHFKSAVGDSRNAGILHRLDSANPDFLMILDERSGPMEKIADQHGFGVVHILPYASGDSLYAASLEIDHPLQRKRAAERAVLQLRTSQYAADLTVVGTGTLPAELRGEVIVGNRLVRLFTRKDRRGLVVGLTASEFVAELGEGPYFALTLAKDEPFRILPHRV